MSWSDPARRFEPAEEVQLRAELRDLLGLGPMLAPSAAAPAAELKAIVKQQGGRSLAEDALSRVKQGLVTLEDVYPILLERM